MKWIGLFFFFISVSGCSYTLKVKDGDTAFDRYQYAKAITYYLKDLNRAKSRVETGRISLKIAESYQKMNQPASALPYYQQAWTNQAGIDALRGKAIVLKMLERYPEAIETYSLLGEEIGSTYEFKRDIQACVLAQRWLTEITSGSFVLSESKLNSRYADFGPFLLSDDDIAFTSDRPASGNKNLYQWTGKPYSDVFIAETKNDALSITAPDFLAKINTAANEGNLVTTKDRLTIYFTRCGDANTQADQYCRIYSMKKTQEGWTDALPLAFCTGNFNYGHAFPSKDGNTLFFACDDPLGFGGYDLYKVDRTGESWSDPAILPPSINTIGDEMFPFLQADTLYFASDYHPGMGGLDVFKSYKTGQRSWSVPENLKSPINSGADDFGLIWSERESENPAELRSGFISSTRPGGTGDDDIYVIQERIPPLPAKPVAPISQYQFVLHIYSLAKIYQNPSNPNSAILGRKILPGTKLLITGGVDTVAFSPSEGPFSFEIIPGNLYQITASAEGYLSTNTTFSAKDLAIDPVVPLQEYDLELILDKLFIDQEIILEDIYYDFDRWEIRPDAEPALNNLAKLLTANPEIAIELASHTDCRGSGPYNLELSQQRAQSAVDYLIAKGVEASRLRAMGYGESKLAITCECNRCSEAEHQQNRRTTFRILEQ